MGGGLDRTVHRWDGSRILDALLDRRRGGGGGALFLLVPLLAVALRRDRRAHGDARLRLGPPPRGRFCRWRSCPPRWPWRSPSRCRCARGVPPHWPASCPWPPSPLVVGHRAFHPRGSRWLAPGSVALPVTALVNALLTVPFRRARFCRPAVRQIEARHGRLADALGLFGMARLRLGAAAAPARARSALPPWLAAALSMGDLLGSSRCLPEPERRPCRWRCTCPDGVLPHRGRRRARRCCW